MPASVPTGCPKKEASWGRARETDHQQEAGGWGFEITAPSEDAKGGEPGNKGAGCKLTHVIPCNTYGSPGTGGVGLSWGCTVKPLVGDALHAMQPQVSLTWGRAHARAAPGAAPGGDIY